MQNNVPPQPGAAGLAKVGAHWAPLERPSRTHAKSMNISCPEPLLFCIFDLAQIKAF